jgi:hypothetical protein
MIAQVYRQYPSVIEGLAIDYLIEQFQEAGEILFAGPGITFPSSTHASGAEPSVP